MGINPQEGIKMLKSSLIAMSAAGVLAGATLGLSTAATAQSMSETWTKYQEAVRVAELCRYIKHDASQWAKMGPYIDDKVNHEIGGGERLTLIETAKSDAWEAARVQGCESDDAKSLLSLYDAELAPLATQ
jgi:hypothetical protein